MRAYEIHTCDFIGQFDQTIQQIQIFLFPIKEPFRAKQLTKNLIQLLWIDYIDWKMTTFYETNKSKCNQTIDIVIVAAFTCKQHFIKADLHVDTFSIDIQNIILHNVKFKYYPNVYAYTHAIWSCRHNL